MVTLLGLVLLLQLLTIVLVQQRHGLLGSRQNAVLIDTCVLIDGRILDLVKSGFGPDKLLVAQCVIDELQYMADGSNTTKRQRARQGLDVLQELQDMSSCNIRILPKAASAQEVDRQLVSLAQSKNYALMTIDYNLVKVAELAGVEVLNINELAIKLRPSTLKGQTFQLHIEQKGSDKNQGVGFSEEGIMVVVDGAARYVGKTIEVEATKIHQTESGSMIFARHRPQRKR